MKNLMAAWIVGVMAAAGTSVSAQVTEETQSPLTVTVHFKDYASLSPRKLAEAQAHATDVYRAVGIDIVWQPTPWMPDQDAGPPSIHVRLVILPVT